MHCRRLVRSDIDVCCQSSGRSRPALRWCKLWCRVCVDLYNEVSEWWSCDVDESQTTLTWREVVVLACLWRVCVQCTRNVRRRHFALIKTCILLFLVLAFVSATRTRTQLYDLYAAAAYNWTHKIIPPPSIYSNVNNTGKGKQLMKVVKLD